MKLSIRENLSKFNLINEGWMESLFNKYDEDILYFVETMLQKAFSDEDISNHPMAEWIAKSTKGFLRGGSMPMKEPFKSSVEGSFQDILNFIKESENQKEDIKEILSKSPKDALNYVKEKADEEARLKAEEEARLKAEELSGEEELKEWTDSGIIKIIGRGPKGSFWVQPLKAEFFGVAQCGPRGDMSSNNSGEFGIGCQKGETGPSGSGAVGFPSSRYRGVTYTLLGKSKDGHYTGIISTGANPQDNTFVYHTLQFGNKTIGSEGWNNFSAKDFMNAFTEFIAKNEYGKKIYKNSDNANDEYYNGDRFPGPFRYLNDKNNTSYIQELMENNDDFSIFYEHTLREVLGDQYDVILMGPEEMYDNDPEKFMKRLSSYLSGKDKEKTIKLLQSDKIDLKELAAKYGDEIIEDNLIDLLNVMKFEEFEAIVMNNVDFKRFIKKTNKKDIEEVLRLLSENNPSADKFLELINKLIKDGEIVKKFGDGNEAKGIVKIIDFLKTPKLKAHQNYNLVNGDYIADVEEVRRNGDGNKIDSEGRVIMKAVDDTIVVYDEEGNELNFGNETLKKEYIAGRTVTDIRKQIIPPALTILQPKQLRLFLKNNKEYVKDIINLSNPEWSKEMSELNFTRLILKNSNEENRGFGLRKEKDSFISYYDKKYNEEEEGKPGVLEYSNILHQNSKKTAGKHFDDGVEIFKLDKNLLGLVGLNNVETRVKTAIDSINSEIKLNKEEIESDDISNEERKKLKKSIDKKEKLLKKWNYIDISSKTYIKDILSYYIKSAVILDDEKGKYITDKNLKLIKGISGFIETIKNSNGDLKEYLPMLLKYVENNSGITGLIYFMENFLLKNKDFSTKDVKDFFENKDTKLKDNSEYKSFIKKLEKTTERLDEQKIRKYIQNLLYDNVKKY